MNKKQIEKEIFRSEINHYLSYKSLSKAQSIVIMSAIVITNIIGMMLYDLYIPPKAERNGSLKKIGHKQSLILERLEKIDTNFEEYKKSKK